MNGNLKDEVVIKIIGKVTQEIPEINQHKLRDILETVLYKYDITSQETALITSDLDDKLIMYLAVKKLEGSSDKTLHNYNYIHCGT